MLEPLEELAHDVLDRKQYDRLRTVSELLAAFSRGGWELIEEDVRRAMVERMEQDFHIRAWDDWAWTEGNALSRIRDLLASEKKAMGIR